MCQRTVRDRGISGSKVCGLCKTGVRWLCETGLMEERLSDEYDLFLISRRGLKMVKSTKRCDVVKNIKPPFNNWKNFFSL